MNLVSFALGNLRRRPARTALTLSAIALGIAAVVALTSIAWGFEASWQKANDARGTDLIVTRMASQNAMPSPFAAAPVREQLARYPHVQEVAGLLSEMLSVGEDNPPIFVFGWAYGSYLWEHLKLLDGRWPADRDEPAVLLGTLAAELLHKGVGDRIELEGRSFEVVGTFQSTALVENGAVLMTLDQAQAVTDKPGKVNVLNLKLDGQATEADARFVKEQVRKALPGYAAITSGELVSRNAVVRIAKAMSHVTILIAGLVGALIVFNTMLMSINERTREIGVLQALGWRRTTIMQLVICESLVLALAGGLVGIAVGVLIASGLEQAELMRGKIAAIYSVPFFLSVLGLSVVLGVGGGLYPAHRAARLSPAQALRHE
ncbi:MAG: ABC transporter permease [Rhodocyclales bacterium]|nr:ABC transporter permease [Rhodocyclales bacterium]